MNLAFDFHEVLGKSILQKKNKANWALSSRRIIVIVLGASHDPNESRDILSTRSHLSSAFRELF